MKKHLLKMIHGYAILFQSIVVPLPLLFVFPLIEYIDHEFGGPAMALSVIAIIPLYGFYCYGFSSRIKPIGLTDDTV